MSSYVQLTIMTIIELVLYNVNEWIGRSHLYAVDAGDSIFVHSFGAYFGEFKANPAISLLDRIRISFYDHSKTIVTLLFEIHAKQQYLVSGIVIVPWLIQRCQSPVPLF